MKTALIKMWVILPMAFASLAHAQEEIYLPANAPLKTLFNTMKQQVVTGKIKTNDSGQVKQTFPAQKAGIRQPGNINVRMAVSGKKVTAFEAELRNGKQFAEVREKARKAYIYERVTDKGTVYLENVATVIPSQRIENSFPHGTGAILHTTPDKKYIYRLAPVFDCLAFAAELSDTLPKNTTINYPASFPFGKNLAGINSERAKYVEMSPNSFQLPLKEIFDADKAGLYIEALALEAGTRLSAKQIGAKRIIKPEEAGISSRDIIQFSILTDNDYLLTGLKASFRFRTTYNEIRQAISVGNHPVEKIEISGAVLEFHFLKENNLCLMLFAAEPVETRGIRGVYSLQAYNYSLGKIMYELCTYRKNQLNTTRHEQKP